jgi:hypothetical protein
MDAKMISVTQLQAWARVEGAIAEFRATHAYTYLEDGGRERVKEFDKAVDDFLERVDDLGLSG